jgi:hypothetical protein
MKPTLLLRVFKLLEGHANAKIYFSQGYLNIFMDIIRDTDER